MDILLHQLNARDVRTSCGPLTPCTSLAPRGSRCCVVQGLLLDCDAATLTVWVNDERKGVMVRPGMTAESRDRPFEPVGWLEGPLRWTVDLGRNCSVSIDGPVPLP